MLQEVCEFIDYRGKTPVKTKTGVPLVTAKIIKNGVIMAPQEFIAEDSYNEWMRRGIPKKGDIIFTTEAPLGEVAEIRTNEKLAFAQRVIIMEPKKKYLNNHYLLYALQDKKLKNRIAAKASGTTVIGIKSAELKKIVIDLPSIEIQEKIADILYSLDEKIALNVAINYSLAEQARSIFQSWFIDYEPFGGSMPSDWHPSTLGQIAVMKTDSWSPAKNPDVMVEHYSIPAFDEQHYPVFEIASGIKSNKYILTPDSVMISKLNPNTKRIWRPMCLSAHPVCSTEFIVYEAKKSGQKDYIYSILDSVPFLNHLCSHTTGSTNSRQRATPKATLNFPILLPSESVIEDFCHIITPMYDLISSNIIENQSLAKTRDSLLPKLMSGELGVSNLTF